MNDSSRQSGSEPETGRGARDRSNRSLHSSLRRSSAKPKAHRLNVFLTLRPRDIQFLLSEMHGPKHDPPTDATANSDSGDDNAAGAAATNQIAANAIASEPELPPSNHNSRSRSFRNAISNSGHRRDDDMQCELIEVTASCGSDTSSNEQVDHIFSRVPNNLTPEITGHGMTESSRSDSFDLTVQRILTCTFCTFGLFNVSRFSILSVHLGGNFILQFVAMSIIFGIPLFWLYASIGVVVRNGPISMWRISPICKGIGIAAIVVQTVIAINSSVSVGWLIVYLKDALCKKGTSAPSNATVTRYFRQVVLQESPTNFHHVNLVSFQMIFCVTVVWTAVFLLGCCQNTRRTCIFFAAILGLEYLGLFALCVKLASFLHLSKEILTIEWSNMFNTNSCFIAAQEAFMTWTLFGSSIISVFSRPQINHSLNLKRDVIIVSMLTMAGLLLSAVFANVCSTLLNESLLDQPSIDNRLFAHDPSDPSYANISPIRLATELLPATLSSLTAHRISAFWTVVGLSTFVGLGITQLYVMWLPLIHMLDHLYNAVCMSCITAAIVAFPLATRYGVHVMYFLDVAVRGSWIVPLLCLAHLLALFLLRGRPYSADIVVRPMRLRPALATCVAIVWNIVCPLALVTLAILQFKWTASREFYAGSRLPVYYWPQWVRMFGVVLQLGLIMVVPIAAAVQAYRYLTVGAVDMFDRIQLLIRPPEFTPESSDIIDVPAIVVDPEIHETPPRYTPPPSYSTATGARIARAIRRSFRKSVRRIGIPKMSVKKEPTDPRIPLHPTANAGRLTRSLSLNRHACRPPSMPRLRRIKSFSQKTVTDSDI